MGVLRHEDELAGLVGVSADVISTGGLKERDRIGCASGSIPTTLVYVWCMTRTNIDIDDEACETVMERYHLTSKRDAVNYALRLVAAEALDLEAARALRGSGWEGNLDEVRGSRTA